jgi:aldehyde:ferredoxin oxidoreductase
MQPILKIDLSTREIGEFIIPVEWERDYLGGSALAARILFESLCRELDPLSPEAPLLCITGPLSGTAGPVVGRFTVCGKSPATGLWAESNCGGFWGPELRNAGWDGVWISGRAEQPVYLWIRDGSIEIRDAKHLWGTDTYHVQELIKDELGLPGIKVLDIGPAGEALIPYALLLCDHGRVAGRTGLGAVMGAKNLKAIAVKGTGKAPVADPDVFVPARSESNRALKADTLTRILHDLGTAGSAEFLDYLGEMPKKYFSAGYSENASAISGSNISETVLAGVAACHACVIACGRVVRLDDGEKRKGPEYETLVGFGPNIGVADVQAIILMGELCDRYGVDSISMSGTIGLAFSLYEKGIINSGDTGGLELNWGNAQAAAQLIHLAVRREGFGSILANGSLALARHFGVEDEAVQVNGLEVAYHDPRGASGMALVYATSPIGASHNQSDYFLVDIGQVETSIGLQFYDRHAGAEKAANVARHQDFRTINNALVMCVFGNVPPETILSLVNAACDYDFTLDDLLLVGERAWNLKRIINNRLGLTRANDKLPRALLEAYPDGGSSGFIPDLASMLEAYYSARGWDQLTGMPNFQKLEELGLIWTLG